MTNTNAFALSAVLVTSMIAQAQQNSQPQLSLQATSTNCEDVEKPGSPMPAQDETRRVSARLFGKALTKIAPAIARGTHGDVQSSDIAQAAAESEAQKTRAKQEHAKYCAALKEAAKKAAAQPTAKVIEACPPNTSRATGTPYCLKPDNTLVDLLHISVPVNPTFSSPSTLTPIPPAPAQQR